MPDLNLTSTYDYVLPEELIAAYPSEQRSESRLLLLGPDGALTHDRFSHLPELLLPGDVLVRNTARVVPARLEGTKVGTGGRVEILVLEVLGQGWDDPGPTRFRALFRSSKPLRPGVEVDIGQNMTLGTVAREGGGRVILETRTEMSLSALLELYGQVPLPPYILRRRRSLADPLFNPADRSRYQTVYAREPGAVAAPTAGLHFTPGVFERLADIGVPVLDLQLDVGVGTFKPIGAERLDQHSLHRERYSIPPSTADAINTARAEGRRIVAVGTTVMRSLEDQTRRSEHIVAGEYHTDLFIRPGFPFTCVQALLTNFHLPRSSLLTLVCAFGGYQRVMDAYLEAIGRGYRFYSYGDAMFLTHNPDGEGSWHDRSADMTSRRDERPKRGQRPAPRKRTNGEGVR